MSYSNSRQSVIVQLALKGSILHENPPPYEPEKLSDSFYILLRKSRPGIGCFKLLAVNVFT